LFVVNHSPYSNYNVVFPEGTGNITTMEPHYCRQGVLLMEMEHRDLKGR